MQILLTNDDGIQAEGIYALYKELKKIGNVTVVAPDAQQSSVGHGITLSHPVWKSSVHRQGKLFGHGITGTPADCVKFAMSVIMKKKPDVVVSGVNHGPNDGCSVFYSGTVAGAREGALYGIPSLAVSLDAFVNPYFDYAARVGAKFAKLIHKMKLTKGTFLSINVPNKKPAQIKGTKITRQGLVPIHGSFVKRFDPNLREYYWMTGRMPNAKKDLRFDTYALNNNYVTVTPVVCDLTDYKTFSQLETLVN